MSEHFVSGVSAKIATNTLTFLSFLFTPGATDETLHKPS